MVLFWLVSVAFLHLSKDIIILHIPVLSSINNNEVTTVILSQQSVLRLHSLINFTNSLDHLYIQIL